MGDGGWYGRIGCVWLERRCCFADGCPELMVEWNGCPAWLSPRLPACLPACLPASLDHSKQQLQLPIPSAWGLPARSRASARPPDALRGAMPALIAPANVILGGSGYGLQASAARDGADTQVSKCLPQWLAGVPSWLFLGARNRRHALQVASCSSWPPALLHLVIAPPSPSRRS